jgi:dienelactone hydrolase
MRLFETLLLLACLGWLIQFAGVARSGNIPWSSCLQLLLGVLLVLQLLIEGWRWQILPLYAVALTAASGLAAALCISSTWRLCFAAAGIAAAGASVCAGLIFQHLSIGRGSGPSLVGVTTVRPVIRAEPAQQGPDHEFVAAPVVQLWYPAAPRSVARTLREFLQARLAAHLRQIDSVAAVPDADPEPATERRPVVLYFGGWPESSLQNRSLICELASRGFVVASLHYPQQPWRPMLDYSSQAAFERTVELDNERARTFARDASATLDELARLDQGAADQRFARQLDLRQAGIVGYSFGGAVAAQASRMDARFKAAVNLDGRHWAQALQAGVPVPYLFVGEELLMPTAAMLTSSDPATRYEAFMDRIDYTKLAGNLRVNGGIQVTIDGMQHINFSDDVLRSPVRRFSGGGTIDAERGLLIINSLVVEFFGRQLAQRPAPRLAGNPHPFPEARADYWPAPATAHPP